MSTKTFCDATGAEMTNPVGWIEVVYVTIGPEPHQERLILCPEAGAKVIEAIESVIRPKDNVLDLFDGRTIKDMADEDGA